MRVTTKEVKHEVDGQDIEFQIRKMNALDGSCLMKFCAEKFLPLVNDAQKLFVDDEVPKSEEDIDRISAERTAKVFELIPKALGNLSNEELIDFEKMCLRTVFVNKPAGWQPVIVGNNFGVEEIEDDIMTVLALCYEVVEFNMGSFFGGKGLASLFSKKGTQQ